jgi:hypothetical protein
MAKISIEKLTNDAATGCNGNIDNYENHLTNLRSLIVNDYREKLNENKESYIKDYNNKISAKQQEINTLKEISSISNQKLSELKIELDDLERNIVYIPYLSIFILITCSILLTVFLCLFYSATVYGATNTIRGAKQALSASLDSIGYIFSNFPEPASIFYLLVPIIFISMGYLVHNSKTKKSRYGFLIITFIVDCILGYLMTKKIIFQNNRLSNWSDVFLSPDFYLLLFMGFVAYIIWGKLIDELNSKLELLNPAKAKSKKQIELSKVKEEIRVNSENLILLEQEHSKLKSVIQRIENNVVLIPSIEFEARIAVSNNEWIHYLTRFFEISKEVLENKSKEIKNISEAFIEKSKQLENKNFIID